MSIENPYSEEEAFEEASKMEDKINTGKAKNYNQAEKQVENDIELDKFHEEWSLIEAEPNSDSQKEKLTDFISRYSKIGYLENYSLLIDKDKAFDLFDKLIPTTLNSLKASSAHQKMEQIQTLYNKESLISDTILTMSFNFKQWKETDNVKMNTIDSLTDRLQKNSITEMLLNTKAASPPTLYNKKMVPLYPQTIKESIKILNIRGVHLNQYKPLIDKITDPNEKSKLITELYSINQWSSDNKEKELEHIIFSHPRLADLIEPKNIIDATKAIEIIQDKLKQYLGDNPTPEQIIELSTKHPEILTEISSLLQNPKIQKQYKEKLEAFLKSTPEKSKENAPAWLEKAKETAKTGAEALGAGAGILPIIIFFLLFFGLNKIAGIEIGGEGKGKK